MEKMIFAGIDPGKKGAIAFINHSFEIVDLVDMPDLVQDVADLFGRYKPTLTMIERQQPFPKQGVVSTFSLAVHYGELLAMLKLGKHPFLICSPREWRKAVGLKVKGRKNLKSKAIELALNLFPSADVGRKDGRAEALLIATYAGQKFTSAYLACLEEMDNE